MRKTSTLMIIGLMIIYSPSWAIEDNSQKTRAQVSPTVNFGDEKSKPITTGKKDIAPGIQDPSSLESQSLGSNEMSITNKAQASDIARRIPNF